MDIRQAIYKLSRIDIRFALLLFVFALYPLLFSWTREALPVGIDWRDTYRPAALAMSRWESPYSVDIYYAAPWGAGILIPFALLPYEIGRILLFFFSLVCFAWIGIRLQAGPLELALFLTSAAVVGCLNNGNIEFLPLLGIVSPPWLGLILLAIKPQVGVGLALFWAVSIWREQGLRAVFLAFLPVSALLVLSFALFGIWPLRFSQTLAWSVDNTSLFPWSVPIGLFLLWTGIRARRAERALASSPFLAPYVLQFTWAALLVDLLDRPKLLFLAWVALWIPVLLRVFF